MYQIAFFFKRWNTCSLSLNTAFLSCLLSSPPPPPLLLTQLLSFLCFLHFSTLLVTLLPLVSDLFLHLECIPSVFWVTLDVVVFVDYQVLWAYCAGKVVWSFFVVWVGHVLVHITEFTAAAAKNTGWSHSCDFLFFSQAHHRHLCMCTCRHIIYLKYISSSFCLTHYLFIPPSALTVHICVHCPQFPGVTYLDEDVLPLHDWQQQWFLHFPCFSILNRQHILSR